MSKQLQLRFRNEEDNLVTISLDEPLEPVNPEMVQEVMGNIINDNVLTSNGGALVTMYGARLVERTVEDIELEV